MSTYRWRRGFVANGSVDPQKVGERISHLRKKHGALKAEDLVEDAKKKSSPLHDCFEWDDDEAAKLYRLEQARIVLRSIVEVNEEELPDEYKTGPYVPTEYARGRLIHTEALEGYQDLSVVRQDPAALDEATRKAWKELLAWRSKWAALTGFQLIFTTIDRLGRRNKF